METSEDVNVVSFDDGRASVGSTMNLLIDKLSTKYIVTSVAPNTGTTSISQLAVAAVEKNTKKSITFKMEKQVLKLEGNTFYRGGVFSISARLFWNLSNFTFDKFNWNCHWVIITYTFVAAFSGNDCIQLDNIGYCDHLIAQLPPTDNVYIKIQEWFPATIKLSSMINSLMFYSTYRPSKTAALIFTKIFTGTLCKTVPCYLSKKVNLFYLTEEKKLQHSWFWKCSIF